MKTYNTLSEAVSDLRERGYSEDFSLNQDSLKSSRHNLELHPEDFEIEEVYRFEGMSSTDDNSLLFAIKSKDGLRGILIDAYGVYTEEITPAMANKLRRHH